MLIHPHSNSVQAGLERTTLLPFGPEKTVSRAWSGEVRLRLQDHTPSEVKTKGQDTGVRHRLVPVFLHSIHDSSSLPQFGLRKQGHRFQVRPGRDGSVIKRRVVQ